MIPRFRMARKRLGIARERTLKRSGRWQRSLLGTAASAVACLAYHSSKRTLRAIERRKDRIA